MSAIDIKSPSKPFQLNRDIYLNNVNRGSYDATKDVKVYLQDGTAAPITPTSSVLVGNDLTITANIPNPAGVALLRPTPTRNISYTNYDTGWRAQNGWYNYTPPVYPAKYAQLDTSIATNQWYTLKTALTVGGVATTKRFVDITGNQNFGIPNNANLAFIDKLTGYMVLRTPVLIGGGSAGYYAQMTTAYNYSAVIDGNTYSDWYMISLGEMVNIFANNLPVTGSTWTDPTSGAQILTGLGGGGQYRYLTADNYGGVTCDSFRENGFYTATNTNETLQQIFYIHDVKNLIS